MNYADIKKQAELALVTYANLNEGQVSGDSIKIGGFSAVQANLFANSFIALRVHQDLTGLSATVFQEKMTGRVYLAVRGTEFTSVSDLLSDGILATAGIAILNPQYMALQNKVTEWINEGVLPASDLGGFTVAGHSLGGYLAGALKNQFSNVSAAYLFNAPGDGGLLGTAGGLIRSQLPPGQPGDGNIWNIKGSEGLSIIAGLGLPQSNVIPVEIEAAPGLGLGNHSMYRLVDSLSVLEKFNAAFPQLSHAQLNAIIDACGKTEATLEQAVVTLARVVLGTNVSIPAGDKKELYAVLGSLTNKELESFRDAGGAFISFADKSPAQILALATGDSAQARAVRVALKWLDPFAALPPKAGDAAKGSEECTLARAEMLKRKIWFNEQEINSKLAYNPEAPEGGASLHPYQTENAYFFDQSSGYEVAQGGPYDNTRRFLFGKDTGTSLTGGSAGDSLFGGGGIDLLRGGAGSDLLEGYGGNDVIDSGTGFDILRGGDGQDWLGYASASLNSESSEEVNGEGNDYTGGRGDDQIAGSVNKATYRYFRGDGRDFINTHGGYDELLLGDIRVDEAAFTRIGNDLRIELPSGGAVTFRGWFEGNGTSQIAYAKFQDQTLTAADINARVGIVLTEQSDTYTGTPGNDVIYALDGQLDVVNGGAGSDTTYGGNGADNLWGGPGDETDYLYGQDGADKLYGEGGDDVLVGGNGVDFLDGGAGNDKLWGSADDDELWGQAGDDYLYGEGGSDKLYGGGGNDFLIGGTENDLLAGGADNDVLYGGDGIDQLWGGTGNDLLFGEEGDDNLYGEDGNDRLDGGGGRNIMVGGKGDDMFVASGVRDEMWGGEGFDSYYLTPSGAGTQKLIFEEAQGGIVNLTAYAQAGLGINLLRNSPDQLILTTSQGETIVVNGWAAQTTSLQVGGKTWTYESVQNSLSEQYGYTYKNVYRAAQFSTVVANLSNFFSKARNFFGEAALQSVFTDGINHLNTTSYAYDGSTVYRWGWKAGTLSDEALSQGAAYQQMLTLFEDGRTRSSATLYIPAQLSDPHPIDRVDLWYDFWNDPVYGWSFAVIDAYSAEANTATYNVDGTITPSAEFNKDVNVHAPATWGLLHGSRNSFQILAASQ